MKMKLDTDDIPRLIEAIEAGASPEIAARQCGIWPVAVRRLAARDEAFRGLVRQAERQLNAPATSTPATVIAKPATVEPAPIQPPNAGADLFPDLDVL